MPRPDPERHFGPDPRGVLCKPKEGGRIPSSHILGLLSNRGGGANPNTDCFAWSCPLNTTRGTHTHTHFRNERLWLDHRPPVGSKFGVKGMAWPIGCHTRTDPWNLEPSDCLWATMSSPRFTTILIPPKRVGNGIGLSTTEKKQKPPFSSGTLSAGAPEGALRPEQRGRAPRPCLGSWARGANKAPWPPPPPRRSSGSDRNHPLVLMCGLCSGC